MRFLPFVVLPSKILLVGAGLISTLLSGFSQATYFQQEVNFKIEAKLDDVRHQLHGQWSMEYHNNSPDTLHYIYLHLWPNAYQNRSTAFAQQELSSGSTDFYFAPDNELGYIDSLQFTQKDKKLIVLPTELGPDVVTIMLNEPLPSGKKIQIESPFRLQFPASFSRLGHVEQSYQATQWYPKPAVYDRDGWHPMAYLDYGEYYSEFGAFDVYLTLPKNYLIGASGTLQTQTEESWLRERAEKDADLRWSGDDPNVYTEPPFPASDAQYKTLHYRAEQVHDFAWFADKRFHVLHKTAAVPGRSDSVELWSFFTDYQADLWQHSLTYLERSVQFYSEHVGAYAYPQMTAVQSALSAGGGMEYPMVTVIGSANNSRALDGVITHEVGHNWFYGVLASNERAHPWMDEGFNSYYDHRYDLAYYGKQTMLPQVMGGDTPTDLDEIGYRYYGCQHLNQAPDTPAEQLKFYNYWVGAYSVPAKALAQLEAYWGRKRFDHALQSYYQEWQFKHPRPEDAQAALETAGNSDLAWLFQGFMQSTEQQDYQIKKVKKNGNNSIVIKNKGTIAAPFPIYTLDRAGDTTLRWHPGFTESKNIALPGEDYREITIDPNHKSLEMHRQNDAWRAGWGRTKPPQFKLITGNRSTTKNTLFALPLLALNEDDGLLPGLILHNRGIIPQKVEWVLAPFYGINSKSMNGFAGLRGRIWQSTERRVRELTGFATYRSFHYDTYVLTQLPLAYRRLALGGQLVFHARPDSKWIHSMSLRTLIIDTEGTQFNSEGDFLGTAFDRQNVYALNYHLDRDWVLSPAHLSATIEYADYTDDFSRAQTQAKLILEGHGRMLYQKEKAFHWRLFGGFFLHNSLETTTYTPAQAFSIFDRGSEDYRFDNAYFDRSANGGLTRQQLGLRAGGLRAPVPTAFQIGRSNSRIISFNGAIDIPFTPKWLPLRPYLDAASYAALTFTGEENKFVYVGGLALEWLDGRIGLYAPLFGSPEIMNPLKEQGGLKERIAFRLLITDLMPWKWADGLRNW